MMFENDFYYYIHQVYDNPCYYHSLSRVMSQSVLQSWINQALQYIERKACLKQSKSSSNN